MIDQRYIETQLVPYVEGLWRDNTNHPYVRPYSHTCARWQCECARGACACTRGTCRCQLNMCQCARGCKFDHLAFRVYVIDPSSQPSHAHAQVPFLVQCEELERTKSELADEKQAREALEQNEELDDAQRQWLLQRRAPPLVHVCVAGACPGQSVFPREHARDPCWTENHLWICTSTGIAHRCSDQCMDAVAGRDEAESTCRLTGYVGAPKLVNDYWKPCTTEWNGQSEAYTASHSDSAPAWQDASELSRVQASLQLIFGAQNRDTIMEMLTEKRRGAGVLSSAAQSRRGDYFIMACAKIAMLFTSQRMDELSRMRQDAMLTHLKVVREYVHLNTRRHDVVTFSSLVQLMAAMRACHTMQARPLPNDMRKTLIRDWAMRCVKFWYVLRTRTKLGRSSPQQLPFYEFIDVALRIFADGLVVPAQDNSSAMALAGTLVLSGNAPAVLKVEEQIVIMEPDVLVHSYIDYASSIDANGVADSSTKLKTRVQACVIESVRKDMVPAASLRIEAIEYERCDQEAFVSLVRPRKASAETKKRKRAAIVKKKV